VTGLQLAPGFADGLTDQIKAVHGRQDADQPGRLLEPFVVARCLELARTLMPFAWRITCHPVSP
jgi:hypothetical protein